MDDFDDDGLYPQERADMEAIHATVFGPIIAKFALERTSAEEMTHQQTKYELLQRLREIQKTTTHWNGFEIGHMITFLDVDQEHVKDFISRKEKLARDEAELEQTRRKVEAAKAFEGPPVAPGHEFAIALQQARVAKKLKQDQLANKLGISKNEYAQFEIPNGKRPTTTQLSKLNRLLQTKLPAL